MIRDIAVSAFYTVLMIAGMYLILGTMLDALEYETTESCVNCKFLPHLSDRFSKEP